VKTLSCIFNGTALGEDYWFMLPFCVCENSGAVQSHKASADAVDLLLMHHVCPMCYYEFESADFLQLHVDTHFDEQPQPTSSKYFDLSISWVRCLMCRMTITCTIWRIP